MAWFSWCDWRRAGPRGVRSLGPSSNLFSRSFRRRNRQCSRRKKPEAGSFCPENRPRISQIHTDYKRQSIGRIRRQLSSFYVFPGGKFSKDFRDVLTWKRLLEFGGIFGKGSKPKRSRSLAGWRK